MFFNLYKIRVNTFKKHLIHGYHIINDVLSCIKVKDFHSMI